MADKQLIQYIQTYHEKGYSIATLRSFLTSRGYDAIEVENAIKEAYLPQHHAPKWIIPTLITMGGLLLAGIIFFVIFAFIQEDITLSVSSNPTSTPQINTPLSFRVNIAGASSNLPVELSYQISRNGELVDTNTQSIDASKRTFDYTFTPRSSGEYVVSIVVKNGDISYRSSFTTRIEESTPTQNTSPINPSNSVCGDAICDEGESCAIDCQNTCGDGICSNDESCPQDCQVVSCGDGICNGQETANSCAIDCRASLCGDSICDLTETVLSCRQDCEARNSLTGMTRFEITQYVPQRVEQVGGSEAAKECKTISSVELTDVCYFEIMKETGDKTYCSFVATLATKNNCYLTYAFKVDDYSVCSNISGDEYKFNTCENLRRAYELQEQTT